MTKCYDEVGKALFLYLISKFFIDFSGNFQTACEKYQQHY
jgi:hypothetical protein